MDNSLIKKHNFEEAKNKIQCFSNNIPKYVYFDKVDVEGGLFGWGDHKVTGTEMNRFIGKVQDRLMSVNTKLCSIIREFREVYNALDYLDKDYIQGIIISVEASEKASEKALKAQEDIRRTIEGLRQTVNALYNLKEDVDEIKSKLNSLDSLSVSLEKHITYVDYVYKEIDKHYNDIDSIRHDVEKGKVDLSNLQQQIDTFIAKTEVENQRIEESISSLQDYCSTLESLVHLKDIDSIWHNVEKGKVDISNLQRQISSLITKVGVENRRMAEALSLLQDYRSTLDLLVHLKDIDSVWHDVEKGKVDISNLQQHVDSLITKVEVENQQMAEALSSLQDYRSTLESFVHLKDIDLIWNNVERNNVNLSELHQHLNNSILESHLVIDSLKSSLCNIKEQSEIYRSEIDKRIKISYIIAGSSIALVLMQSIFILIGIL